MHMRSVQDQRNRRGLGTATASTPSFEYFFGGKNFYDGVSNGTYGALPFSQLVVQITQELFFLSPKTHWYGECPPIVPARSNLGKKVYMSCVWCYFFASVISRST